jgi:hypothetical protein
MQMEASLRFAELVGSLPWFSFVAPAALLVGCITTWFRKARLWTGLIRRTSWTLALFAVAICYLDATSMFNALDPRHYGQILIGRAALPMRSLALWALARVLLESVWLLSGDFACRAAIRRPRHG